MPAYFLGDWLGHRRDMTVRSDGTASFSDATMVTCGHEKAGQPCDAPDGGGGIERLDLRIDVRNGAVFATVVHTNDAPDDPVGTSYQLVPAADQTFVMRRTGRASFPMCSRTRTKDLMAC